MGKENQPPRMTEYTFAEPRDLVPDPFTLDASPKVHNEPLTRKADPFEEKNLPPKASR